MHPYDPWDPWWPSCLAPCGPRDALDVLAHGAHPPCRVLSLQPPRAPAETGLTGGHDRA